MMPQDVVHDRSEVVGRIAVRIQSLKPQDDVSILGSVGVKIRNGRRMGWCRGELGCAPWPAGEYLSRAWQGGPDNHRASCVWNGKHRLGGMPDCFAIR